MGLADGTVFKFLCDQLGSPRVIVNATTGTIAETIAYDPWGKASVLNYGAFAQWQQPFGFAGGLYDEDTGLVRFGARDYDAEVGRWLAKDPILLRGGQANLYVYAGDDPVNAIDPTGLWGVALGDGVDAGFCFGLCAGSYGAAGGLYVGTEGLGVFTSAQAGAGFGAHAGASVQLSAYSSLDAFSGTSYGVEGSSFVAGGSYSVNPSGRIISVGAGPGGGAYGGLFVSKTRVYGVTWREMFEALGALLAAAPPLGVTPICP